MQDWWQDVQLTLLLSGMLVVQEARSALQVLNTQVVLVVLMVVVA